MADHTVLIKRLRRVGEDGCDPDLPHDAADALEAQAREIEALRKTAANAEGMAESMCMFREDMLGAGVISKGVPPMFMTEAVMSFIGDLRREIEALRADAGRYRWLRDNTEGVWAICKWECNSTLDMEGYYRDGRAPAIVDAAIDAAMSAEQGVAS